MAKKMRNYDTFEIHTIIKMLGTEPCLYGAKFPFYEKKRIANAYQSLTTKVNEAANTNYDVEYVIDEIRTMKKKYHDVKKLRKERSGWIKPENLPGPPWWKLMDRFMDDDAYLPPRRVPKTEDEKNDKTEDHSEAKEAIVETQGTSEADNEDADSDAPPTKKQRPSKS